MNICCLMFLKAYQFETVNKIQILNNTVNKSNLNDLRTLKTILMGEREIKIHLLTHCFQISFSYQLSA